MSGGAILPTGVRGAIDTGFRQERPLRVERYVRNALPGSPAAHFWRLSTSPLRLETDAWVGSIWAYPS